jgi:type VI secretion system protein VasI
LALKGGAQTSDDRCVISHRSGLLIPPTCDSGMATIGARISARLLPIILAGLATCQQIEGWPKAQWGMTEKQVLAAFHGDAKVLMGEPAGRQFKDRLATVGIDDVAVGGVSFRALFLFDSSGGLARISLPLDLTSPADDQFRQIESFLAGKYGEPLRGVSEKNRFQSAWMLPTSMIVLDYLRPVALTLRFDRRTEQTTGSLMQGLSVAQPPYVFSEGVLKPLGVPTMHANAQPAIVQNQLLPLPDWLRPFAHDRDSQVTAEENHLRVSYSANASFGAVVGQYETEMQSPSGVKFSEGSGVLRASQGRTSCAVKVRSVATDAAQVDVECFRDPEFSAVHSTIPDSHAVVGASATHGTGGWSHARWGMTQQQIRQAFPGQVRSVTADIKNQTETLAIDQVVIGGLPFRVEFVFHGDSGLRDIVFDLPNSTRSEAQFRKLQDWVSREYGQRPIQGARGGVIFESYWLLPDNVINIIWTKTGILVFGFSQPNGQTAESVMKGMVPIREDRSLGEGGSAGPPAKSSNRPQPVTEPARPGKWQVTESKSQFDDSRTVVLSLLAENGIKGWLATSMPQLILRCQEKRTEVYLVTGMSAAVEYGESQRHTVRLRYDDDLADSILASQSTDSKALFFPDPMNTVIRMWSAQALVVGFTPFNANPVTIRFDVSGLPTAVRPLRDACGW